MNSSFSSPPQHPPGWRESHKSQSPSRQPHASNMVLTVTQYPNFRSQVYKQADHAVTLPSHGRTLAHLPEPTATHRTTTKLSRSLTLYLLRDTGDTKNESHMRCTTRHPGDTCMCTHLHTDMDTQPSRAAGGRVINRACMTGARLCQQDPGVVVGAGPQPQPPLCLGPREED